MLKPLLEKRAKLVADMRGTINVAENEDRDFTAEETAAYDALQAEKESLDVHIGRLEGADAAEAALSVVVPTVSRRGGIECAVARSGPGI